MEHLIGKKIRVRIPDRNIIGKIETNRFTFVTGICTFAGYNEYLEDYQITIDRTPIFPIQFKDVEIIK
jgi:hypothetical protein